MQQPPGNWPQAPQGWGARAGQVPYTPQVPAPEETGDGQVRAFDALKFLFRDSDWQHNLLIGSVFYMIPMVGALALMGWHCEIMQRLVRKHPKPIPKLELSDLTHYLGRGVTPFVVSLLTSLPISMGIGVVAVAIMMVGAAGAATTREPAVMILVGGVGFLLSWVVGLLLGILMNAAMTRAELTEDFGSALALGRIIDYAGKTWWRVLLSNFVYGLVAAPLIFIGYALCFVGMYPALIVIVTGMTHLRHQQYASYLLEGGEPVAVKPAASIPSELQAAGPAGAYPQR